MKKITLVVVLLAPLFYFSCKSGSGDPRMVVSQFFGSLHKKDIPAARKFATAGSKSMLDKMEAGMKMLNPVGENDKFDPKMMEVGEPAIDGDNATVSVMKIPDDEKMVFTLRKEDGDWKIAFDEFTLLGNAIDKMKASGINVADSIGKAMSELKGLNIDSLKREIKSVMDSVKTGSK